MKKQLIAGFFVVGGLLLAQTPKTFIGGGGGGVGGSGAATTDHFVTTQAEADLSAEFNLGGLAAGCLGQTVSGSVSTPVSRTFADGFGIIWTNPACEGNPSSAANTAVIEGVTLAQQGGYGTIVGTSGTDAYAGSPSSGCASTALTKGMVFWLVPDVPNTTAATFAPCGLTAKAIKTQAGADPATNTLLADKGVPLIYDTSAGAGNEVWVLGPSGSGSPGGSTTQFQINNGGVLGGMISAIKTGTLGAASEGVTLYNPTATTGVTNAVVRNGAGNSADSAGSFFKVTRNDGSETMGNACLFYTPGTQVAINCFRFEVGTSGTINAELGTSGLRSAAQLPFCWAPSTDAQAGCDTGFNRNAAGVVEVTNGTANAYRDLKARAVAGVASTETFSATPSFDLADGSVQIITLTGNVTSSTVANGVAQQEVTFHICQDGTGNRTFAWPASFHGAMTIGATASMCSEQKFRWDGTAAWALTSGVINQ